MRTKFGRSAAASMAALISLMLPGCDWVFGVVRAVAEGEHYQVRAGRVEWIHYSSGSTSSPPSRLVRRLAADPDTFEVLGDRAVARDASRVFCKGDVLPGAESASIRVVQRSRIAVLDGGASLYIADNQHAWMYCDLIPDADGATFSALGGGYARDADTVFLDLTPLNGADATTFRSLDSYPDIGKDKDQAWASSTAVPLDMMTFRYLGQGFMTDGKRVFLRERELKGADPGTFHVPEGRHYGRDRSGCWSLGRDTAAPCVED